MDEETKATEAETVTEEQMPEVPETEPEDKIAPFRAAAARQKENTTIIGEHDTLLAELLYEITMQELEN